MCRLLETIKIKENRIYNIDVHNSRCNLSRRSLFHCQDEIDLRDHIDLQKVSSKKAFIKCRISYREIVESVAYLPYELPRINSLKTVGADDLEYAYKYENREALAALVRQKGECDEVIILKKGYVTDTSFSNLVFYDGSKYRTPARPLLAGTKRAVLLETGKITTAEIKLMDFKFFQYVFLINSMIDLEDRIGVAVEKIIVA
jgi:4-amino-4-deoxychorismate lyase